MLRSGASLLIFTAFVVSASAEGTGPRDKDTYFTSSTYASLRGTTPDACEAVCENDQRCEAWSLTPPTFRAGPRCELKASAGKSVLRVAAVSGVVRLQAQPQKQPVSVRQPALPASPPQTAPQPQPNFRQARPAPTERIIEAPMGDVSEKAAGRPLPPGAQRANDANADRPWPGLRNQPQPQTQGERPLPIRRQQDVPAYSVQNIERLPGDDEGMPADDGA